MPYPHDNIYQPMTHRTGSGNMPLPMSEPTDRSPQIFQFGDQDLSTISSKSLTSPENNLESSQSNMYPIEKDIDLLILIDSNRRHVDWKTFWTLKGSERKCGSLFKVEEVIQNMNIRHLKYVVINIGVNDLDTKSAEKVFRQLQKVIELLREKFEGINIFLSEITPRTDARDTEVIRCNEMIETYSQNKEFICLSKHNNLRTDVKRFFSDTKHISVNAIPIVVANIKRSLRKAYGIVKPNGSYVNYKSQDVKTDLFNFKKEMKNILQQINSKISYNNPPWH